MRNILDIFQRSKASYSKDLHRGLRESFLDFEKLNNLSDTLAEEYRANQPFPHIVIDDFVSEEVIDILNEHFPPADESLRRRDNNTETNTGIVAQKNKLGINSESVLDPVIRQFLWELNSSRFIRFLENLTGISGLLVDPHLRGGGTHRTMPGGLLRVHADFNKHPDFGLDRRINFLLYLNESWLPSYGGNLELWDKDMTACQTKIAPIAGRCVIFNTSSWSFHGHPKPLTCPQDRSRLSIAMYYYTNGRPASDNSSEKHATLWPAMPEENGGP